MLSLLCYQKYTCLYPFNFILLGIGRAEYVLGMIYLLDKTVDKKKNSIIKINLKYMI